MRIDEARNRKAIRAIDDFGRTEVFRNLTDMGDLTAINADIGFGRRAIRKKRMDIFNQYSQGYFLLTPC